MANVICSEEYCKSILNKEDKLGMTFAQKASFVSAYIVFAVALGALVWYGAGYYPVLS